eukprot:3620709-Rhodomonas_salina.1
MVLVTDMAVHDNLLQSLTARREVSPYTSVCYPITLWSAILSPYAVSDMGLAPRKPQSARRGHITLHLCYAMLCRVRYGTRNAMPCPIWRYGVVVCLLRYLPTACYAVSDMVLMVICLRVCYAVRGIGIAYQPTRELRYSA